VNNNKNNNNKNNNGEYRLPDSLKKQIVLKYW
jgi:hypothetical protein